MSGVGNDRRRRTRGLQQSVQVYKDDLSYKNHNKKISMIIELNYHGLNILLCLSGNKSALNNIIVFDDEESHTN